MQVITSGGPLGLCSGENGMERLKGADPFWGWCLHTLIWNRSSPSYTNNYFATFIHLLTAVSSPGCRESLARPAHLGICTTQDMVSASFSVLYNVEFLLQPAENVQMLPRHFTSLSSCRVNPYGLISVCISVCISLFLNCNTSNHGPIPVSRSINSPQMRENSTKWGTRQASPTVFFISWSRNFEAERMTPVPSSTKKKIQ